MNKLTITISGGAGVGKTTMALLLGNFLIEHGASVIIKDDDIITDEMITDEIAKNRINAVLKNASIVMKTKQVGR